MAGFEIDNWDVEHDEGKDEDGNLEIEDKILKIFVEKTNQVIKKVDEIGLPQQKQQLRIITMQPFNAVSLIKMIAERETVVDALFVIFAINKHAAHVLIDLKEKKLLNNCRLLVSQIRNAGHKSKSLAVDLLKPHFDVSFFNSHAKIMIMKTVKGNFYSIEGSGNMSFNGRLEQYVIDNDEDIYNFSKEWISEVDRIGVKR